MFWNYSLQKNYWTNHKEKEHLIVSVPKRWKDSLYLGEITQEVDDMFFHDFYVDHPYEKR